MPRVLAVVVAVALTIYAVLDCVRTDSSRVPARIPRAAWLVLIIILPVLGPLMWLLFKNQDLLRSGNTLSADSLRPKRKSAPSAPLAPDDDPEFLARLEARNRRRAYEQKKREELGESPSTQTPDEPEEHGGLYGRRD